MSSLAEKAKALPNEPGVYLLKDKRDEIIYVGKAKNLRKRVSQYFGSKQIEHTKVRHMVNHVVRFDYIVVENEVESLVLEANLIKEYKPKYNILMRDDKHYPYIKITNESYPRVMITREVQSDGAQYFGPYPIGISINLVLDVIHELFPLRTCRFKLPEQRPSRPCLNYDIDRCLGPCKDEVSVQEYGEIVEEVIRLLQGNSKAVLDQLDLQMDKASKELQFETAANYRDKMAAIRNLSTKQIADQAQTIEQDVIGMARKKDYVVMQVFFIRQGKIIGRESYQLEQSLDFSDDEVLAFFIKQLYSGIANIPKEIIIDKDLEEKEVIEDWLSMERGNRVRIIKPQRGERVSLVTLAKKNALEKLYKREEDWSVFNEKRNNQLLSIKKLLQLDEIPYKIEAYDISHVSGVDAVGSMIVFKNGLASKQDYRRFRIHSKHAGDDYQSLREMVERRIKRGLKITHTDSKDMSFLEFPDLMLIDGGKGQVNIIENMLLSFGVFIPVGGMVKDAFHQTRGLIYKDKEISLIDNKDLMKLIASIQNEAHRFAISYHRSLRSKRLTKSLLDDIPGVGPKRREALLKHFGDVQSIRQASVEELMSVPGINKNIASTICGFFKEQNA